jgi:hypothetical protein
MVVYGHSFDPNDAHVFEAVVRSKVTRLAVSLYGDVNSPANRRVQQAAIGLVARRGTQKPLEVRFFPAGDVQLWEPV